MLETVEKLLQISTSVIKENGLVHIAATDLKTPKEAVFSSSNIPNKQSSLSQAKT
jgi:hypothetical protein